MVGKNRLQIGILFVCCIAAILSGVTLYLVAVRGQNQVSSSNQTDHGRVTITEPNKHCEHTDDIAIIGAGIAGSYAAWRLRRANLTVTLYEYSNRIGGRCNTIKFPGIPDINVELGAMRFHPNDHVMLNKTLAELGLDVIDFLPENNYTMYYLRGTQHFDLNRAKDLPYNLKREHMKSLEQLQWEIFSNYTTVNSSINRYTDPPLVLRYETPDGIPLYQQGFKSFYGKYLYPELEAYVSDVAGFSSSYQDVSASRAIPIGDPHIPVTETFTTKTVVDGFQAIPETMVQEFTKTNSRNTFKRNHHLKSIRKLENGHYEMTFRWTETIRGVTKDRVADDIHVCAKTVLLAIPRLALEQLDLEILKDPVTADYIKNSLFEAKAGKMYFAYDYPWWRNITNYSPIVYSTTPLKVSYNFGESKKTRKAVLNPVYNDIYTDIWKNTLKQGNLVPGVGDETIQVTDIAQNMTRKLLAQIYGILETDVPQPTHSVMRIWDEYPFGASWYHYRPGYLWHEVADHMMKPSTSNDVYIISNTFSPSEKQTWTEGALEIVDSFLKKYFAQFYDL